MRVLQLGPFPPPHGGVQTNLVSIREYLRAHGHQCGVINITRHRSENRDEVWYPKTAGETLRLLATLPSDIIHLHIGGTVPSRVLALAAACAAIPGRKSVLTFHSGGYASSPEGQNASPWSLRGFVFRQFDGIIAVNQEIVDLFRRFGVPAKRIRLIEPHSLPPDSTRTELPPHLSEFFARHNPVLLSVGLLEPEYDLPLQIDTLGSVREKYPDAGLVMLGSGSLESDLRARMASKPWAPHMLLPGDTPHAVTLRAITEASALLRTTLYDGDAVSVREALHLGTPVIATDNGMRPAGVHLIPVQDGTALVARIQSVVEAGKPESRPQGENENMEAVVRFYSEI